MFYLTGKKSSVVRVHSICYFCGCILVLFLILLSDSLRTKRIAEYTQHISICSTVVRCARHNPFLNCPSYDNNLDSKQRVSFKWIRSKDHDWNYLGVNVLVRVCISGTIANQVYCSHIPLTGITPHKIVCVCTNIMTSEFIHSWSTRIPAWRNC